MRCIITSPAEKVDKERVVNLESDALLDLDGQSWGISTTYFGRRHFICVS